MAEIISSSTASDMAGPFTGSCHCGQIKYTLSLPPDELSSPKANRCNCTWCQKPLFTGITVSKPADAFTLLSPAEEDKAKLLGDYQSPGMTSMHRWFCLKCGTHVWREGSYEYEGQKYDHFTVNLCTIDQPQEGIDVSQFVMNYCAGRDDSFQVQQGKPFKGGVV